jgi:carbonic anhydrase/acetyltransferase-like protein (isoleucine patch superfamily)
LSEADLIEADESAVVGGARLQCAREVEPNVFVQRSIHLGRNSFVADCSVVLGGCDLGGNVIVGSMSLIEGTIVDEDDERLLKQLQQPQKKTKTKNAKAIKKQRGLSPEDILKSERLTINDNEVWIGSPGHRLSSPMMERELGELPKLQLLWDIAFVLMSLILLPLFYIMASVPTILLIYFLGAVWPLWASLLFLPVALLVELFTISVLVLLARMLCGRKAVLRQSSFWGLPRFLWQFNTNMIGLHASLVRLIIAGTFVQEWWMRLLGYNIGRHCFLDMGYTAGKWRKREKVRNVCFFFSLSTCLL